MLRVIAAQLPARTDAISYYRGLGPLNKMAKENNMLVHQLSSYSWATLGQVSALFMQRPYTKNDKDIFVEAAVNRVPIWLDYDDLLSDIPTSNPCYFEYQKPEVKENIVFMIKAANVVTVSTQFLARQIVHLNPNVVVLPNAFDVDAVPYRDVDKDCGERSKMIYWRGSRTHHKDVWTYKKEILAAAQESKEWKYHFIGDNLWFLTDEMDNEQAIVADVMQIEKFFMHLWRIAPSACIVPLHDCKFNRAKSNIAYLEASMAGAVTIAPAWEEWSHPGIIQYKDNQQFLEAIRLVTSGEIDVRKSSNEAWAYVKQHMSLSKANVKRRQVFERILM